MTSQSCELSVSDTWKTIPTIPADNSVLCQSLCCARRVLCRRRRLLFSRVFVFVVLVQLFDYLSVVNTTTKVCMQFEKFVNAPFQFFFVVVLAHNCRNFRLQRRLSQIALKSFRGIFFFLTKNHVQGHLLGETF